MKVAISMRQETDKHGSDGSILEDAYVDYLQRFGIILYPVPNTIQDVDLYLKEAGIEGVILSGGNDVDPHSYGGKRKEGLSLALKRDEVEKAMIDYALKLEIPLLGICRGMQFLNVYYGGKIIDFKENNIAHPVGKEHHHSVEIQNEQGFFGKKTIIKTTINSYHNQGLTEKELSSALLSFAVSTEGIIEGFYHPALPIVGIQWHPERSSPDKEFNRKLVSAFVTKKFYWKK